MERKTFEAEIKESSREDLTVTHFISTEKVDRGRDILYADGMKILGRPVVMLQHGYTDLGAEPIAKPLWIKKGEFRGNKGVQAKTQFYPDELGRRLWDKTVQGFMPNWSIGWRPLKHEYLREKDGMEIRHVYEWELLEYSLVSVPMQPDAQTPTKFWFMIEPEKPSLSSILKDGKITISIPDETIERMVEKAARAEIARVKGRVE